MLLKLVPTHTRLQFMRFRRWSFPVSGALVLASLITYFVFGLNYGIDFVGGTLIEIKTDAPAADIADIRSRLNALALGDVEVQQFGAPRDVLVRVQAQEGGESAQQEALARIRAAFADGFDFRRVEIVGPRVSSELALAGTIAVIVALLAVLAYIWLRFEWQFALGAIVTVINDIFLTIGLFVILQLEFSLSSIAAILTIIGYSLNDTVVVYDRIRENLRRYKKMQLAELIDMSINEMLSRTVMTSLTTLIALFALVMLGGQVIQTFTLAMIFGVVIGTFSSIFIAAPLLIFFNLRAADIATERPDTAR